MRVKMLMAASVAAHAARTIRAMPTRTKAAAPRLATHLHPAHLDALLKVFLVEDLGDVGDVTSDAMIPAARQATAVVRARGAGTLSGVPVMQRLIALAAPKVRVRAAMRDGQSFRAGDTIATLQGPLRGILKVERTLLNLLGRMSGVATATRRMVDGTRGTTARIRDTRKTTPGLRALEKYAVVCGGGVSHRSGLYDAFLAKDNHLDGLSPKQLPAAIVAAVSRARRHASLAFVMVEVDTPAQFSALLTLPRGVVDAVLLDNMTPAVMRRLVAQRDRRAPWLQLEASGGISARSVRAVARSGVDFISSGAITHSAPQVDFSLDIARGAR
jgi:nicotinate-nucleotide pyrophosphorylase (carboxylating)